MKEYYDDKLYGRFDFLQEGHFEEVNFKYKYIKVTVIAICVLLCIAFSRLCIILLYPEGSGPLFAMITSAVGMAFIIIACIFICNLFKPTRQWHYKADNNGIELTSDKNKKKYYAYKDILAVTYEMNKDFGKINGLKITIATRTTVDLISFSTTSINADVAFAHSPFYVLKYPPKPKMSREEQEYYDLLRK